MSLVAKDQREHVRGVAVVIGDKDANYVNKDGRILSGPEYLTVFDNTGDGIVIDGTGNTIRSVRVNNNGGDGVEVNGTGNTLRDVRSNIDDPGDPNENGGAEFRLNATAIDGGSNEADNISIPTAAKCPTFPNAGTVCE